MLLQQLLVPPVVGLSLGALFGMLGAGAGAAPHWWLFMAISKPGADAMPTNLILLGAALSQGPLQLLLPAALPRAARPPACAVVTPVGAAPASAPAVPKASRSGGGGGGGGMGSGLS